MSILKLFDPTNFKYTINDYNLLLDTDSYKPSHWLQYPPNTQYVFEYVESRGGLFPETVFAGIQPYLKEYLSRPFSRADIDEAEEIWTEHGVPFNRAGWESIYNKFGGYLPVEIAAIPEGTVLPVSNLMSWMINTHPDAYWMQSHLETSYLRANWYMTSVATQSYYIKKLIIDYFNETASPESFASIDFRLHDFGARGVSSFESSGLGGLGHLMVFKGTDTINAVRYARKYYNEPMAGFSIPAAEHSSITSWGRPREKDAYENMIDQFAGKYANLAIVSDSFDIYNAVSKIFGEQLISKIQSCNSTVVVRPDSGTPHEVVLKVVELLGEKFGYTTNVKGYKVLSPYVRVIQGDGICYESINEILATLKNNGWSSENVFFGMGGQMLQKVDRDMQKFAAKASCACIDGEWVDVYKDPITDKVKKSKKGMLTLYRNRHTGEYVTNRIGHMSETKYDIIPKLVFRNGEVLVDDSLSNIRERINSTLNYLPR